MRQTTGEDKATNKDGVKEDTKEEWLKGLEIRTMPASAVGKWAITPGTVHRGEDRMPSPTSLTSITMIHQSPLQRTKSPTSDCKSVL